MDIPTNEDWIDWARALAQIGDEKSRTLVSRSLELVPNEIGMHWAPFALGIPRDSLRNYIVNIGLVSDSEFETAESNAKSDFPSWFEVLRTAKVAIEIDASCAYDFWDAAFDLLRHYYPELSQPCPRELHYGEAIYHVTWGGDLVSMDNAFSDFVCDVDDQRRTCWIDSSFLESQPIIFGIPANVDRLTKRLGLGTTKQMPRQLPRGNYPHDR